MASSVQILPQAGRPNISPETLEAWLTPHKVELQKFQLWIVGIRGFFPAIGPSGQNDRNVYDDAIILRVPSLNIFSAFNGNTDPSRIYNGFGKSEQTKGMAVLKTGLWPAYRFDRHNGNQPHEAICQRAGTVTVIRDGDPPYPDTGNFGINIHRGGYTKTSSLGCQTIPPEQWDEFYYQASDAAKKLWGSAWKSKVVAYVLLENKA
ncbi:hypothetical protein [Nitrosomonas sp.]|uniref:hypothetical protein n=1 Tax=Nitrosomonas sp. TaxID=42353 RepID=UPI0025E64721|nr:hypothetical protein [Nitrosomonas sp.]